MSPEEIKKMKLEDLVALGSFPCECGKNHEAGIKKAVICSGAVRQLPGILRELGCKKPFLLSGHDSYAAAGELVEQALKGAGIPFGKTVFPHSPVKPTEETVGSAVMHFDYSCDCVVGIGSGVINDTGKILAHATGRPYMIVGTAPSMDGFASATSSMDMDGLKVSLDSTNAQVIIGDLDVLAQAPMHMLLSGVGDMLAKIVSLAEWRIANLLVDEYYCPVVSALVENALEKVLKASSGLLKRDKDAVAAVMEGLVIAGLAMKYAGLSRPASGMEHYFSHIWDMRALAFPACRSDLHGIQCGIGTLYSLKVYDYIRQVKPDRQRALDYVASFSTEQWNRELRSFIGPGAEAMIEKEQHEQKYDRVKHAQRLDRIMEHWDELLAIVNTLPGYGQVLEQMTVLGAPTDAAYLGYTKGQIAETFRMTKDIRDKYIASRLLWDLGLLDEAAEQLFC
jgi:glycerol-1-phosphate dehydrogenase [NAD(P)+]